MGTDALGPSVGFVGAGRAATALGLGLSVAGYRVVAIASRSPVSARRLAGRIAGCATAPSGQAVADMAQQVFITTPDAVVAELAAGIRWRQGQWAVHCSGALTRQALDAAAASGAETGSFHPLSTFSSNSGSSGDGDAPGLRGAIFGIEAEGGLRVALAEMAERLGGTPLAVPAEARALYHAAAVMSCGHLVALLDAAMALWRRAGLPDAEAAPALTHLASATLANLRNLGPSEALTGPVPRGDIGVVRDHLEALALQAPELLPSYAVLGDRSAQLAAAGGRITHGQAQAWRELLRPYQEPAKARRES